MGERHHPWLVDQGPYLEHFNPNHDKFGRFATANGSVGISNAIPKNARSQNLDKWGKRKDTNVLYVTGKSGSGKSTIAKKLADRKTRVINLDSYFDNSINGTRDEEFDKHLDKHLPNHRMLGAPKDQISFDDWGKLCAKFEVEIENYGEYQHSKGKKVIAEGVELLDDTVRPDKSFFKDKPVVLLKTNSAASIVRAAKRDDVKLTPGEIKRYAKDSISWQKDISKFNKEQKKESIADKIYNEAAKKEPKITKDVSSSITKNGGAMHGLENRLKTKESIARKSESKNVKDAVRYTAILSDKSFVSDYNNIKKSLKKKGYIETRCKNYFEQYKQGTVNHKSVQTNYKTRTGYEFEIQFQTKSSQKAKDKKVPLYEEARNPKTTQKRKNELTKQMRELADQVNDPKDIEKIKSH